MDELAFTNSEGIEWDSVAANVHDFMCPDTGRACHSLCMCYEPEPQKAKSVHVATCIKYRVRIFE